MEAAIAAGLYEDDSEKEEEVVVAPDPRSAPPSLSSTDDELEAQLNHWCVSTCPPCGFG